MKKLEELISKRNSELEAERRAREVERETKHKDFVNKITTYPSKGVGYGLTVGLVVGFYKGCGLFHYQIGGGKSAYLFDVNDAIIGFIAWPLIGGIIGFLYALISANSKRE